jgi:small subunit ribosomal protein S8
MTKDCISDMITRLRNSSKVFHNLVEIKYSKIKVEILKILKSEGYIKNYMIISSDNLIKTINVFLKYEGWWIKSPVFSNLIRISKPGRKVYFKSSNFTNKSTNLNLKTGLILITNSHGVMTHLQAKSLKLGGEALFYIS